MADRLPNNRKRCYLKANRYATGRDAGVGMRGVRPFMMGEATVEKASGVPKRRRS